MTPYENLMAVKCTNCKYLYQHKKNNEIEGTDHTNYCKKSGQIILEMHVNVPNVFSECFCRIGVSEEE